MGVGKGSRRDRLTGNRWMLGGASNMSPAQTSGQSAADRRSAEAQMLAAIAKLAPTHLKLIGAVRRQLKKRLPTSHELVYDYRDCVVISFSPSERGYEGVLALRASAEGVRLCFNRGKELPDPEKLLRGSGAQVRWMQLDAASTLARPAVAHLIEDAIDRNSVPFERGTRGSVILRSTSAKAGGRRKPAKRAVARAKTLGTLRPARQSDRARKKSG